MIRQYVPVPRGVRTYCRERLNMQNQDKEMLDRNNQYADKEMLDRINQYADKVLHDIDPQKTPVSVQLEKLRPIMEEIAREQNVPLENIFIKYMDLASEAAVLREQEFQDNMGF